MPRNKSPEGKPVDAAGTELRAVRVELTPTIHKRLRLEAAKQDRSMASLVRVLVEDYLSHRKA
jgi:predicted HicB family RNase H-like nuclease